MTDKKKWVMDLRSPVGSLGAGIDIPQKADSNAESLSESFSDEAFHIKQNLDALTEEEQQNPLKIFEAFMPDEVKF